MLDQISYLMECVLHIMTTTVIDFGSFQLTYFSIVVGFLVMDLLIYVLSRLFS